MNRQGFVVVSTEKSASEIDVKLLVFFTFFVKFFYENINQESADYMQDDATDMLRFLLKY